MCWLFRRMLFNNLFGQYLHILGEIPQSIIDWLLRTYVLRKVMQLNHILFHPRQHAICEGYTKTNTTKRVEEKEKEDEDEDNTSIHSMPVLRSKCVKLEEEKQEMKTQRDDALRRLSEVMSSKLRDNNPNIVDLSDEFRPTKLAEMSSELYDNEWTEAFTVIEDKLRQINGGIDEKRIIQILLDIFMVVYRVGETTSEREWKTLVTSVMGSTEPVSKEDIKYLKDLRKKYALGKLQEAQKTCLETLRQSLQIEPSHFDEERLLVYINGCVKLCWLAQYQDPPVVFVCPGFQSLGDNPIDGLTVSSNLGPERTTTSPSLADNPNDRLAVSLNFSQERISAPGSLNDDQNDSLPVEDTMDVSSESTMARGSFSDIQNDSIPVSLKFGPADITASGSFGMNERCFGESPSVNQFGATACGIDQMKAGENEANNRIEFDEGLRNEFEWNGQNEGERVPTEKGTRPENVDDDRTAFDKTLYREYTKSGGYIEYVVWPVMLLHEAGPILAKGVAQGCD